MKTRTGYLIKRNKTYYACWTVNGKKFMKTTKEMEWKKANAELQRIMSPFRLVDEVKTLEHIAGEIQGRKADIARLNDERNPPLKIKDAWQAYANSTKRPDSGPATLRQYELQFASFVRWLEEEHATVSLVQEVSNDIAQEYASHLQAKGSAAGTFTKHIRLLHLVFTVVADKARLAGNPWAKENITRKKALPQSRRELTVDELRKVCESATGVLRPLMALGLYTGMRLGDCCTLRWGEVDLTLRVIRRLPNKTARNGAIVRIPIHPTLFMILEEIPKARRREYVLPELAALYTAGRRYLVTDQIQNHFMACGITTQKPGTGQFKGGDGKLVKTGKHAVVEVGFHSLRHSFVSICRAANVPLSVVESLIGHSNPTMTRLYTHTNEAAAGAAVALLPDVTDRGAKVLPPVPATDVVDCSVVLRIVEKLTPANADAVKAKLLKILGAA